VTVGAIGSILGVASTAVTGAVAPTPATQAVGQTAKTGGTSFGDTVVGALDGLQSVQSNASNLAIKAATGNLNDVHAYTIAASEASLATEFTVALRNKAVEAFNDIMKMQI
jgi:flagellar hook-basal body complex protein FliE